VQDKMFPIPLQASLGVLTSSVVPSQNAELQNVCLALICSLFKNMFSQTSFEHPQLNSDKGENVIKRFLNL
jgi:hypothetical protein